MESYTCFIASFPGFHHLQHCVIPEGGLGMRLLGSRGGRISLWFFPRLSVLEVQSALSHMSSSLFHTHKHTQTQPPRPHTHTHTTLPPPPPPHTHTTYATVYAYKLQCFFLKKGENMTGLLKKTLIYNHRYRM